MNITVKNGVKTAISQEVMRKINSLKASFPNGKPIGITFETRSRKYLYDTNTGKVMECDEAEHALLQKILAGDFDGLEELAEVYGPELGSAAENLLAVMKEENILSVAVFKKMYIPEDFEKTINSELRQMVIELTEKCNLRCGYCIYNEGCDQNRNFGTRDISEETALKAVDYAIAHSKESKELAITFYGGEPLIKYDLMKKCVDYAKEKIRDKELTFSFTTNGVLMTRKIAEEIARIEGMSLLLSIDGPKEIHDLYRRNAEGKGSFDEAVRGLRYAVEAFGDRAKDSIILSMVYAPPYSPEKLQQIQDFFDGLDWLPGGIDKFVTYPSDESVDCIRAYMHKNNIPRSTAQEKAGDDSLLHWSDERYADKNLFSRKVLNEIYLRIYKRQIFCESVDAICMNGCCLPGHRRLYVTVNGDFKMCERVGEIPNIGNLETGIDLDTIRRRYLLEYYEKSIESCSACWAARLCNLCYTHSYDEKGFNAGKKEKNCQSIRSSFGQGFCTYFEKLESDPDYFDFMEDIELK